MPALPSSLLNLRTAQRSAFESQAETYEKTNRPKASLRNNAAWMLAGRAIYFVCQFGMLVILASLGSPQVVGQFVLALAICSPVFVFASLQLHVAQCTDVSSKYSFVVYRRLRTRTSLLALLVVCTLSGIVCQSWNESYLVLAMGLAKTIESYCDIYCGRLQKFEHLRAVAVSLIWRGITALLMMGVVFYQTENAALSVVAVALGWLAVFVFHDAFAVHRFTRVGASNLESNFPSGSQIIQLSLLTLPLGMMAGLAALEVNLPRYIVQGVFGTRELGILGVMAYVTMAGNMVIAAVGMAAIPRLAIFYGKREMKAFRSISIKIFAMGIGMGLAMLLFSLTLGRPLLAFVFGREYAENHMLLVVYSVAATLQYGSAMLSVSLRSMGLFRSALFAHASSLTATLAACMLLINVEHLISVGYALVLSSSITLGVFTVITLRHSRNRLQCANEGIQLPDAETLIANKPQQSTNAESQWLPTSHFSEEAVA